MTLWMRKQKHPRDERSPPYHLPGRLGIVSQDTHYFHTLCQSEVKGLYGQWDITEDPPESECCVKCLQRQKIGGEI